jgi:cell division septum initiation protein DivIVA
MSFNPDDVDAENEKLREENEKLKKKVEELSAKVAEYELVSRFSRSALHSGAQAAAQAGAASGGSFGEEDDFVARGGNGVGRKSIPFSRRTLKQHQGRMAYLLKKLENKQTWTQDTIADLHSYFVATNIMGAGKEFFRAAVVAFAGENADEVITDIDMFLAMLQN